MTLPSEDCALYSNDLYRVANIPLYEHKLGALGYRTIICFPSVSVPDSDINTYFGDHVSG